MPQRCMCPNFNWEYLMIAELQRRKLNMFKWREGMLSPRALFRGNPARVKFAAENSYYSKVYIYHKPRVAIHKAVPLSEYINYFYHGNPHTILKWGPDHSHLFFGVSSSFLGSCFCWALMDCSCLFWKEDRTSCHGDPTPPSAFRGRYGWVSARKM